MRTFKYICALSMLHFCALFSHYSFGQAKTGNATTLAPCSVANTGNGASISPPRCTFNNVTVKNILITASKAVGIDERGWMQVLTPGNQPDPPTNCAPVGQSDLKVFVAGGFTSCRSDYCNLVAARMDQKDAPSLGESTNHNLRTSDKPLIWLTRRGPNLIVNAELYDETGDIILTIKDNQPHLNRNRVYDWRRPDPHSLEVIDNKNRTALRLVMLNKSSISIEGYFYSPKLGPQSSQSRGIILRQDSFTIVPNNITASGVCNADTYTAVEF